jgi:hypothetical protein
MIDHRIARWLWLGLVVLVCALVPATSHVEAQEMGYDYMQISVDGKTAGNFVRDTKYNGWMEIEAVTVRRTIAGRAKPLYSKWMDFPKLLQDGKSGPGQMEFGVGDEGGLEPLLDAQKRHLTIPQVELDHYTEIGNQFVGKFILHNVRILSLKDVPASACPMYEVRISFQSISKN